MNSLPIKKIIEDVLWCIRSPDLICHKDNFFSSSQEAAEFAQKVQRQIDIEPQMFQLVLQQSFEQLSTKRLGDRFELFWLLAFILHPDYEIIDRNIQIICNKKTLGELDFLVKDLNRGKIIHLELSCKFYLWLANSSGKVGRWIGPGKKDFLDKKLIKTFSQQLSLPLRLEAKQILNSKGLQIDESKVIFRGRLFLPASKSIGKLSDAKSPWRVAGLDINQQSALCHWGDADALRHFSQEQGLDLKHWQKIVKPDWFSEHVLTPQKLDDTRVKIPVQLKYIGSPSYFFLVEPDWPDQSLLVE